MDSGCDSGFGHQLALKLNAMRFHVFAGVLDVDSSSSKSLKSGSVYKQNMQLIKLNVTEDDDFINSRKLVEKSLNERNLQLFAIVNNAGNLACNSQSHRCHRSRNRIQQPG